MINSLLEALIVIGPLLGSIAYVTIAERKIMGSMQRRVGPFTFLIKIIFKVHL